MKKLLLYSLAISIFAVTGCKKDEGDTNNGGGKTEPTAQQNAVAFYFSGHWCGPCGLYGKPAMKKMKEEFGDKMVLIACQLSSSSLTDPMANADASSLAGVFKVTGVPTCFIGASNDQLTATSGGSAMESTLRTRIASVISKKPVVSLSGTVSISGENITVNTKTNFLEDLSDEWLVGVYVLENNMLSNQYVSGTGWVNNTDFSHILRKKLSSSVVGTSITTTGGTKGSVIETPFTGTLDPSWKKENIEVALVLWKKVGTTVSLENGVIIK